MVSRSSSGGLLFYDLMRESPIRRVKVFKGALSSLDLFEKSMVVGGHDGQLAYIEKV